MRFALILISCSMLLAKDCIPISSSKILARDITGAAPLLSSLDPETVIAFAPLPGVQRVITGRELLAIAQRNGLEAEPTVPSVCVERAMRAIDRAELSRALVTALGVANAQLEILDFSNQAVPPGHLEFRVAGLNRPPADAPETPVIWRGRLVYDGDRSLAVWAKVRITVERSVLIAVEAIQSGGPIRAEQVKVSRASEFPLSPPALDSIVQVSGKCARRTISAGQRIVPAMLAEPMAVVQGETVHVRVVDGFAALTLEAIAQSTGARGEAVMIRNPTTGKTFRAVVEDKGKVIVRSSEGVE